MLNFPIAKKGDTMYRFAILITALIILAAETPDIDTLWDYSNPKQTEILFKDLLKDYPKEGEWTISLKTQLARAMGMQQKFDSATAVLDDVEGELKKDMAEANTRYNLEMGRVVFSSGDRDKAREYFQRAIDISEGGDIPMLYLDALHMMAMVLPPEEGIKYNLMSIEYIEKSENDVLSGWLGPLYNNTAWTYNDLGEYDKAMKLFLKDAEFRQAIGDDRGYLITQYSIGFTHRQMGNIDRALQMQEELRSTIEENRLPPDGYNLEELGELYMIKGEEERAKEFFGQAYEILSQDPWLISNEPDRLERLKEVSGDK